MIPKNSIRNRIFEYAEEKYGTLPEYLWSRTPDCAVLRREDSGKWYAVIMDIKAGVIGAGDGIADIINVKCDELMIGNLLLTEGFFPAYHMNKDKWITILLDGSVSEKMIFPLIDMSYDRVGKKSRREKQ